ncbi:hypothetical protein J2T57_001554 [Natronocella acetinitrilica]|uniref:Helicase ATP-binding domain-containing protein n=1 Tax=Natronocella acetinitrilica TaxID=414046 RepID=A0AAE3KFU1_9GAMM|nr:DEAD/DEAH box helicase [Natronocella acetinitrilica]MCP1674452.1 hypothetical protein [Natronocella acetinitrilica]
MRTYGELARDKEAGRWVLCELAPHVAIRLKQLFPRLAKWETRVFRFPADDIHCADLAWFTARYPLAMKAADRKALLAGERRYHRSCTQREEILTPDYTPSVLTGLRPGQAVRPYQGQAIDLVCSRRTLLLGDDVGLGKTYSAAGLMVSPGTLPAAVVVQTNLQYQWEEKLTGFTTLRVHRIRKARPYALPEADVYLFRYSQLLGWIDFFQTGFFTAAVFDEAQELRTGRESAKGRAAAALAAAADYRLGLSATPIYNYGVEMWNIYDILEPGLLGSHEEFLREWTNGDQVVRDPDALGTYLREQHVFLRRTKADVGQQMPPVNTLVEHVSSDPGALAAVEELARALAQKTTTGSFMERGRAGRELDLLLRQATGIGKAPAVAQFVRILLEAGVPVLLAGWHREVYRIWLEALAEFNPVMYTGSESPAQKEAAKRAFASGETNLMIISLRSAAGLDGIQYRCSTVVAGELDWSPKVHEQLVGRLYREGQTTVVDAIYLNTDDGSDPPMVELLGLKDAQSAAIIDPNAPVRRRHSDKGRIQALAERYLAGREGGAAAA